MCVLHVSSDTGSFAAFLRQTRLPVYKSHEKGDSSRTRRVFTYHDSGFSCIVSDGTWKGLHEQIEDAIRFLETHGDELRHLLATHEVDDIRLDFPYELRLSEMCIMQSEFFPPQLLLLAGSLGIAIEMSLYPRDGEWGQGHDHVN